MLIWVLCFTCAASYSRPGSVSSSDSGLLVRSHIYCSPCNGNVSNNPTSEEGPTPCCQGRKEGLTTGIWFPDNNMGRNWHHRGAGVHLVDILFPRAWWSSG